MVYRLNFILIITFLFTSCEWFKPREAEKPWEEESEWQEPISPSIVISNLKRSLEDRNIVNYSSSLSKDFVFLGDPADSPYVQPGVFNDWYYNVEIDVITKVFNTFGKIDIYLEDSLKDSTGTDASFYEIYSMNLESPDSTIVAKGIAQFHLSEDSLNLWSIIKWEDFRTNDVYIDWGILKAKSR